MRRETKDIIEGTLLWLGALVFCVLVWLGFGVMVGWLW